MEASDISKLGLSTLDSNLIENNQKPKSSKEMYMEAKDQEIKEAYLKSDDIMADDDKPYLW